MSVSFSTPQICPPHCCPCEPETETLLNLTFSGISLTFRNMLPPYLPYLPAHSRNDPEQCTLPLPYSTAQENIGPTETELNLTFLGSFNASPQQRILRSLRSLLSTTPQTFLLQTEIERNFVFLKGLTGSLKYFPLIGPKQ